MARARSRSEDDSISGPRETIDRDEGLRVALAAFEGLRARVEALEAQRYAGPLTLADVRGVTTEHGGTRLPPGMLEELSRRLAAIDSERERAEAFARGQKSALDISERESARRLKWLKWGLSVAVAAGSGLGFLLSHVWR